MKVKVLLSHVRLFVTPQSVHSPGSSVHGILQARILERVAIPFSRESYQPRDQSCFLHCRQCLYHLSHQGSPKSPICVPFVSPQDPYC